MDVNLTALIPCKVLQTNNYQPHLAHGVGILLYRKMFTTEGDSNKEVAVTGYTLYYN